MGLRSTKFITYHDGNCNNTTANYGTFYLNLNNTTSNANWNIDASILSKAKRKARRTKRRGVNIHSARQMLSYLGWIDKTDVYGFYLRYIKPKVSFKALRLYEGHWQRIHNQLEVKHHVKLV